MPESAVRLATESISIAVNAHGAELSSLRDRDGIELLWQAAETYPRQAPVLFPIIGRLPEDTLRHHGREYRLAQHGFARDRAFTLIEETATFVLESDEATLAMYPFPFRLAITYEVDGSTVTVRHLLQNPGRSELHASLGGHPAFRWPLGGASDRLAHTVEFLAGEIGSVHLAPENLLDLTGIPSPVVDGVLPLTEALFDEDVHVFSTASRRRLRFGAPGHQHVVVDTGDFEQLGLWALATEGTCVSPLLCIEPWSGFPTPRGFDADFADKPGQLHLAPGASRELAYGITVEPAP